MATSYKLTYFNMLARGEPIRMLLSYGGLDFEDKRISRKDWQSIKSSTPYGQVPVLEIDEKKLTQTIPICRYLATIVGLSGQDSEENLKIDAAAEILFDILIVAYQFHMETEEARKTNLRKKFENVLLTFLPILNENVKNNGGYIALDRITWADIVFLCAYEDIRSILEGKDFLKDYPNLKQINKKLLEIPNLKNWIKKRPVIKSNEFDLKNELLVNASL